MNRLEEYRDKEADSEYYFGIENPKYSKEEIANYRKDLKRAYKEGFDAAIALDLPVKFADWKDKYTEMLMGVYYKSRLFESGLEHNKEYTNETLYQYWIENIYKPE